MVIIVLTTKLEMANILKKNHYSIIPLFHYSMIEAEAQTSDNTQYFHLVVEIPIHLKIKPLVDNKRAESVLTLLFFAWNDLIFQFQGSDQFG